MHVYDEFPNKRNENRRKMNLTATTIKTRGRWFLTGGIEHPRERWSLITTATVGHIETVGT